MLCSLSYSTSCKVASIQYLNNYVFLSSFRLSGVPLGLTFGTLPFVFKHTLSYTQLGTFLLAAYPFSLKLLWSPVVDSLFISKLGRRKSWIVPMQLILAALFYAVSYHVEDVIESVCNL